MYINELRRNALRATMFAFRFFTLIELLVVIAIIAILSALSFPALNSAKGTAKRIKCSGMMRTAWFAVNNYADEHDGYSFPLEIYWPYYGVAIAGWHVGYGLPKMLAKHMGIKNWEKAPSNTSGSSKIIMEHWVCPSVDYKKDLARKQSEWVTCYGSYWCNLELIHKPNESYASNAVRLNNVATPSRTVLVLEGIAQRYYYNSYNYTQSMISRPHLWHNRKFVNVVYVDGHVEPLTASAVNKYRNVPAERKVFWNPR